MAEKSWLKWSSLKMGTGGGLLGEKGSWGMVTGDGEDDAMGL